jgi:hypothetical protein
MDGSVQNPGGRAQPGGDLAPNTEGYWRCHAGFRPQDLAAIGFTNQRGTTVLWSREPGTAIYTPSYGRCCTEDQVAEFSRDGGQDRFPHEMAAFPLRVAA